MRATVLAGLLLLGLGASAPGTEVRLKNGTRLEGVVVDRGEPDLTLRISLDRTLPGGGRMEGTGDRRIPWGDIETIDGLRIAAWLESIATAPEPVAASGPPVRPRERLARFGEWLDAGRGAGVGLRLGAIALLVVLPGLLVLLGARALRIEHVEGYRSFGGAVLALAAGAAGLGVWPGWASGWPLGAMGAAVVAQALVLRPPPLRGALLALLELAGLCAVVLSVPSLLGGLP